MPMCITRINMKEIQSVLLSIGSAINAKTVGLLSTCGLAILPFSSAFASTSDSESEREFGGHTGQRFGVGVDVERAVSLIKAIYKGIFSISTPLAAVIAVIACLFWMFSSNPRTVETAKSWLKRVLIAWVLINTFGLIITSLSSWLAKAGA